MLLYHFQCLIPAVKVLMVVQKLFRKSWIIQICSPRPTPPLSCLLALLPHQQRDYRKDADAPCVLSVLSLEAAVTTFQNNISPFPKEPSRTICTLAFPRSHGASQRHVHPHPQCKPPIDKQHISTGAHAKAGLDPAFFNRSTSQGGCSLRRSLSI
jgi:hypothetical protein